MATFQIPAPNQYKLPPVLGYPHHDLRKYRNPQYTMAPKFPAIGKPFGPGPRYHLKDITRVGKSSPPAYSIKSRHYQSGGFVGPGAGTYSPEKCPRMKDQRPPCYTLKSRHPGFKKFNTPGPNKYMLPPSIGCKIPDIHNGPCYTMRPRIKALQQSITPGPKYLYVYKPTPPIYSMRPKVGVLKRDSLPGPKYYPKLPACIQANKRGFSFGLKITKTNPYYTEEDRVPACVD